MILQANALHIPLADGTVQTCVTSPPYFFQRDYQVAGQIGLEPTMQDYIEKLVAVFREVRRVLRDDGTLWLNIDDSYAGGNGNGGVGPASKKQVSNRGSYFGPVVKSKQMERGAGRWGGGNAPAEVKRKNLMMIPARLAIALQDDGWYVRCDIVWEKPNAMPESATDRPNRSHEYLFLLSKSEKYYYDAEAIKEPAINNNGGAFSLKYQAASVKSGGVSQYRRSQRDSFKRDGNKNGNGEKPQKRPDRPDDTWDTDYRNKRSVWTVNTKSYAAAHFATYPPKLIEPCILAGTSAAGQCPKCGAPWERVVRKSGGTIGKGSWIDHDLDTVQGVSRRSGSKGNGQENFESYKVETLGWQPTCTCDAGEPVPQIVLDPFSGSGTTGQVAIQHRRRYVGLELNMDYIKLSRQRTTTDVMLFIPNVGV